LNCNRVREYPNSIASKPTVSGEDIGGRHPQMMHEPQVRTKLSVVIPCYNEEAVIHELHRRVTLACRSLVGGSYELVLVNDGSFDGTWAMLQELAHNDDRIVAVDLSRNHGHQLALSAGLSLARGERILVIDADLQDPPELLSQMMRLMDNGADVVYGQRVERDGETWFKRVSASAFYRLLLRMTDVGIPSDTGDFRLMRRPVLEVLLAMPEQQRFIRGMVAWIGFRQVPLQYRREKRFAGETKYPLRKMLTFAIDAITGFSTTPLRISLYIASIFVVIAFLLATFVLFSWLFLGTVQGWTSMFLAMLIFASVQLFSLSVIGEYLGRIYMQTKHRPLFIIREIVSAPVAEEQHPAKVGEFALVPEALSTRSGRK
jgi:polyisoprenyl-phosphate glycosyltransferase